MMYALLAIRVKDKACIYNDLRTRTRIGCIAGSGLHRRGPGRAKTDCRVSKSDMAMFQQLCSPISNVTRVTDITHSFVWDYCVPPLRRAVPQHVGAHPLRPGPKRNLCERRIRRCRSLVQSPFIRTQRNKSETEGMSDEQQKHRSLVGINLRPDGRICSRATTRIISRR